MDSSIFVIHNEANSRNSRLYTFHFHDNVIWVPIKVNYKVSVRLFERVVRIFEGFKFFASAVDCVRFNRD